MGDFFEKGSTAASSGPVLMFEARELHKLCLKGEQQGTAIVFRLARLNCFPTKPYYQVLQTDFNIILVTM